MDITRKTSSPATPYEDDQEDWDFEILQAMVSPSTAEDAALACAAAWMNFVRADRVAVAVFETASSCIVAHGQREDSHLTIYVGRTTTSAATLLHTEDLYGPDGPCSIDSPDIVFCWPEHLSAVLISIADKNVNDQRICLLYTSPSPRD